MCASLSVNSSTTYRKELQGAHWTRRFRDGLARLGALAALIGAKAVYLYMKQSPIPGAGPATDLSKTNPAADWSKITRAMALAMLLPLLLGSEGSGTVEAVGTGVSEVSVGDRVAWGMFRGSYTQYAVVPVSALKGWNVVNPQSGWCGYSGPSLLQLLERLPVTAYPENNAFAFAVQWVEKSHDSADTSKGRRVYWGRVHEGVARVGDAIKLFPGGQPAIIKQVLNSVRQDTDMAAGHSAGLVLDREVDVSRGDWLMAADQPLTPQSVVHTTIAWLDDEPLVAGRVYWALHGHRWVKAKVQRIVHRLDIHTLEETEAHELPANAIGHVELALQQPMLTLPFAQSRVLGALVLVDTASHKTSGAVLVR